MRFTPSIHTHLRTITFPGGMRYAMYVYKQYNVYICMNTAWISQGYIAAVTYTSIMYNPSNLKKIFIL